MRIDEGFAESLLKKAMGLGADMAEVYVSEGQSIKAESKKLDLHALDQSKGFAYSIRTIKGGNLGFSYSNDPDGADMVVRAAIDSMQFTSADEFNELPEAQDGYPEMDISDPLIREIDSTRAVQYAKMVEKAALEHDDRIKRIRKASASFASSETLIMNSKGLRHWYAATSCSASIMAVAEAGKGGKSGNGDDAEPDSNESIQDSQMGWGFDSGRFVSDIDYTRVGREGARRAVDMLGAGRPEPQRTSLLVDNSVAAELLSVLASMMSADNVQKKKSLLAGKVGQLICSPHVNITDNPLRAGTPAQRPMDSEGVSTRANTLVEHGRLMGYMHNTHSAAKWGVSTTANALRGGASALPGVGPQCLIVEPSDTQGRGVEDMLKTMNKGLYLQDAMGVHTINPVSGEYSIGVSGQWIEGGQAVRPIKEAVISGNLLDLFRSIESTGSDLRFFGSIGSPSLLIPSIDLSA